MDIQITDQSKIPIYEQIKEQIKEEIVKGYLQEGTALPSIRKLAADLRVSVITTKRAYDELEESGLIYTIPAKGSYVSGEKVEGIREKLLRQWEQKLKELVQEGLSLQLSLEEMTALVALFYEEDKHA